LEPGLSSPYLTISGDCPIISAVEDKDLPKGVNEIKKFCWESGSIGAIWIDPPHLKISGDCPRKPEA